MMDRTSVSAALLLVCAFEAQAQEYCVACTAPDALYRCVIADPRPGVTMPLQEACATAIARDLRHQTCAIKRDVTVFQCDAPIKRVSLGAVTAGIGTGAKVLPPEQAPTRPLEAPPSTVLEAAQRAKQSTDATMKDAAAATSSFFKKSLTCIGSLFTKCASPQ